MGGVDLRLVVTEAGWARATISHDGEETEVAVSGYTDGIADFLSAVADLRDGASSARWCWIAEPDANWMSVQRDRDWVRLSMINVPTMLAEIDDPGGMLVLRGSMTLDDLAATAVRAVEENFDRLGDLGYRRCWGHPYPSDLIKRITAAQSP